MNILTVANIVKRKRIDLCARACAEMEQIDKIGSLSWLVIGRGKLSQSVQEIAPRSMTLLDRVDSLRDYYRQANVFVLPSYAEGFGMVYIEAIMCGCPVVCRKGDGGEDIVRTTGGGLAIEIPRLDKLAVKNIVEATLDIAENRHRYMNDRVVQAARQMVDPDRIRSMWSEVLKAVGETWEWSPHEE